MDSENNNFIEKCIKIHGDKYTYSFVNYTGNRNDVIITCTHHGNFKQKPHNHLSGKGCPECAGNKKIDVTSFKEKSNLKHNFFYNYDLITEVNSKSKVTIICPKHGSFKQSTSNHINGDGCPLCGGSMKSTSSQFIERSNIIHKNKFDYSLTNYINNKTKVVIICPKHGKFEQYPSNHLKGIGCMECSGKRKLTNKEFIEKSNIIHKNKFDYSLTNYINNKSKVTIICPKHGKFEQIANYHLSGHGCLRCPSSKMEEYVNSFLESKKLNYKRQHSFPDLKDKGLLKFDFAIFDSENNLNFLLEYNGIQHYKWESQFGMKMESFINSKRRDDLKLKYCLDKKINLFIIKYDEKIDVRLNEIFSYLKN